MLLLRRKHIQTAWLTNVSSRHFFVGLSVWLGVGLLRLFTCPQGWLDPRELGLWSPYLLVPIVLLSVSSLKPHWLARSVTVFIVALTLSCLFGLVQFAFNIRPGMSFFRGALATLSQSSIPGLPDRMIAGGFFYHRLKMAHVLLPGIGLLVARQMFFSLKFSRRVGEAAILALFSVTLLLTYTRGALVAAGVATIICLFFARPKVRWPALAVIIVASGLTLLSPTVRDRIQSIGGKQAASVRGFIWAQWADVMIDNPLGVGIGNYPTVVGRYYDRADPYFPVRTYAHNIILSSLAETGPVGTLAYIWAWVAIFIGAFRILRQPITARVNPITAKSINFAGATGIFGTVAFWTLGMTHDVLFHPPVALAFAGLAAAILAYINIVET